MGLYGTGAKLTSEQEQAKLGAYRQAGGSQDLTDYNILEDPTFQNWSGGDLPQGGVPGAMDGLQAAGPQASPTTPDGGGMGTSLSGLGAAAPQFTGFGASDMADQAGGGEAQVEAFGPGYRPNLGQRTYSNELSPLAGLRRIY